MQDKRLLWSKTRFIFLKMVGRSIGHSDTQPHTIASTSISIRTSIWTITTNLVATTTSVYNAPCRYQRSQVCYQTSLMTLVDIYRVCSSWTVVYPLSHLVWQIYTRPCDIHTYDNGRAQAGAISGDLSSHKEGGRRRPGFNHRYCSQCSIVASQSSRQRSPALCNWWSNWYLYVGI